jgi:hypothetical protein
LNDPLAKHLRRRGLHHQQRRADRTDAGNLGETSVAFIGLVPGHELGVDFGDLRLQLRIFFSLGREQLASQDGHVLISLNAIEQRFEAQLWHNDRRHRLQPKAAKESRVTKR